MKELRAAAALILVTALGSTTFWLALPRAMAPHPATPQEVETLGYAGSEACRSCHPSEYASWSASYHRTMTRKASELAWNGERSPSLPADLENYGRGFRLSWREGRIVYRGPDLHLVGRGLSALVSGARDEGVRARRGEDLFTWAPEVERELVLVTGSHHYLAFWIEGGEDQELRQFPFVYLLDEGRFLPRQDAFLQPPDAVPHIARWNGNCIQCHAVAGRPKQTEGYDEVSGEFWEKYETQVAEEGISCEACHGPGKEHAAHYRNPLARVSARRSNPAKAIFVPREEEGARGSAACGQCHSYFLPKDADTWWTSGFSASYLPGEDLSASRTILRREALLASLEAGSSLLSREAESIFWPDGSILVGGREYNGLTKSPCYEHGKSEKKLSCSSCHSMHHGPPDKQLRSDRALDRMCTDCHSSIDQSHSAHPPESPGARCVNCHMPKTSYALLHGIASHQITSPRPSLQGAPHACALCHVDRSSTWIQGELERHFEISRSSVRNPDEPEDVASWAVTRALSGNAAERALFAYAFGTEEALGASGPAHARAVLPYLTRDPYAAVRLIAERSLAKLPPLAHAAQAGPFSAKSAKSRAKDTRAEVLPVPSDEVLTRLMKVRDNTPIVVSE